MKVWLRQLLMSIAINCFGSAGLLPHNCAPRRSAVRRRRTGGDCAAFLPPSQLRCLVCLSSHTIDNDTAADSLNGEQKGHKEGPDNEPRRTAGCLAWSAQYSQRAALSSFTIDVKGYIGQSI